MKSATASKITPTLPDDSGNDNVDKGNKGDIGNNQTITTGARGKNNPDANVKDAAPAVENVEDPKKKTAPEVKGDSKGEVPVEAKNTDATTKTSGEMPPELKKKLKAEKPEDAGAAAEGKTDTAAVEAEKAAAELIVDPQYGMKIASLVLAVVDGRAIVERELQKAHGMAAADDIIKAAAFMEEKAIELAQLEESGVLAAQEYWAKMPEVERAEVVKIANVLELAKTGMDEEEKQAFDQGAGAAAQMADAGAAGEQEPQTPGADEVSDEDIVGVLDQMVQSGELTPEVASQIMQALQGGGEGGAGGAGAEGGMPPEAMGGAGGPPPDGQPGQVDADGSPEGTHPEPDGDEGKSPEEKEARVLVKAAATIALQAMEARLAPAK